MKISWNCLNQLVNLNKINILQVEEKLILAGLEIENKIEDTRLKDTILELSLTTNRQDIIGFINIAIELAALFQMPLKIQNYSNNTYNNIQVKTLKTSKEIHLLNKFQGYIIKDIQKDYRDISIINTLIACGLKPTYSILDIISFINLKWGQEIQIYKLPPENQLDNTTKIFDFHNTVDQNKKNIIQIQINNQVLIQINKKNIQKYKNISSIILINYTSNILRKNQYVNHKYSKYAYIDLFNILSKISQKTTVPYEIYQYIQNERERKNISFKLDKVNRILGPNEREKEKRFLNKEDILPILKNLNFDIKYGNNEIKILAPNTRRKDIIEDVDIIEEIGRIYGFNNFKNDLPIFNQRKTEHKITYLTQQIRRILRSFGLHEIINYSIQPKQNIQDLKIINPLNKDQAILRNNLIKNILITKNYNTNQVNLPFEVFEIGNVFNCNSLNQNYQESLHLSGLLSNNEFNQSTWKDKKSSLTWFQAKGHIEEMMEKINAEVNWSINTKKENSHFKTIFDRYIDPKQNISITYKNKVIGILSRLNYKAYKLINKSYNIYFFEININELAKTIKQKEHLHYIYSPYSSFPKIARDLSLVINANISMEHINQIIAKIKNTYGETIESISVRNEYYNSKKIRTICLRITYRSKNRTLTNEEVEILDKMFKAFFNEKIQSKT